MIERFKSIKLKEVLRFLVGGGSAVLVDFLSYHFLMWLTAPMDLSKVISYIFGAIVGFIINKFWTFESKQFRPVEIFKYIILYAFSAGANTIVNHIVISLFDISILAFFVATGVSTVINFFGQKFFVFHIKKEDSE